MDPWNLELRRIVYHKDGKECFYVGQVNRNTLERNGVGKQEFYNNTVYVGQWLNGLFHGHGKLYSRDLEICYTGEFTNGKMNGFGEVVHYSSPKDALQKDPKKAVDKYMGRFNDNHVGLTGRRIVIYSKYDVRVSEGMFANCTLSHKGRPDNVSIAVERAQENQRITEAVLSHFASFDLSALKTHYLNY